MSNRERTESGEFAETITRDAVLSVFESVDGPVVTSTDVAEALDCSAETARRKLRELYSQGEVDRRKTGRIVVWWRVGTSGLEADPVDPDDPFFTDRSTFASGTSDTSGRVDEILYGG